MIKVNIKKNNVIVQTVLFDDSIKKDEWLQMLANTAAWGKPERWVKESECSETDIANSLDFRIIDNQLEPIYNEYLLPSEYDVEELDPSVEIAEQNRVSDGKKRQELGAEIIAKVYSINESKNIDATTFANLMADSNLERIERLLWTGSLRTAKLMIQALDNTYFTNEEIQSILDMLVSY